MKPSWTRELAVALLVHLAISGGLVFQSWAVDDNTNGLDDVWELYYDAIGVSPGRDEDGDGKTNLEESRAGTDPFDPDDFLRIENLQTDGADGTFTFRTQPGKIYQVFQTSTLRSADWTQVGGDTTGDGAPETVNFSGSKGFFRIDVSDLDSDGDGLSDWAESILSGFDPNADFSANSSQSDLESFRSLFATADVPVNVSLAVVEAEAFENFDNGSSNSPQSARIRVTRTGRADPLVVFFTVGGAGNAGDYTLEDESGTGLTNFVQFGFGEVAKEIHIVPIVDSEADYPVDVSLQLNSHSDYEIIGGSSGSVDVFDANDTPGNQQLFYGQVRPERGAVTSASGYATLRLNGKKTRAVIDYNFSALSSNQIAAHIHQSQAGGSGGISNGPVVESLPLGIIDDYVWNIHAVGAYTGQDLIDSLYGQNGHFPLYANVHTASSPGGEIWAFLSPYDGGDFVPPGDPPGISPVSGDFLTRDVVRFLQQATYGARQEDVDALIDSITNVHGGDRIAAYDAWIDDQLTKAQTSLYEYTWAADQEDWALNGNDPINNVAPHPAHNNRRHGWWAMAVTGKDQLRQRVAFALSQIFVISDDHTIVRSRHYGTARYYDMLAAHADGTYRSLLLGVSKSPMMGKYLTHLQNRKATYSNGEQITSPDENYAREIMQLFSIGLVYLNPDGSLQLNENGEPFSTYGNDDITELARVFTGWSFSKRVGSKANGYPTQTNSSFFYYGGPLFFQASWENPMTNFSGYHDTGAKSVLGESIPAGLNGQQDMEAAIDILVNHQNIAPFVARRLIQRLVTANPSAGYIYRVAQAFSSGNGGDIKAAVKAVLLDYEARELSLTDDIGYGKQKEPLLRYVQLLRTAHGRSQLLLADLATYGLSSAQIAAYESDATQLRYYDMTAWLGQSPQSAPSVFNWFLPDYVLGGPLAQNGLFVPEFTITSESQVIQAVNAQHSTIMSSLGFGGRPLYGGTGSDPEHRTLLGQVEVISTRLEQLYNAASGTNDEREVAAISQVLDEYDLLLCAGVLKQRYGSASAPNPRSAIIESMRLVWNGSDDATNDNDNDRLQASKDLLYLICASPDFLIQR